MSILGVDPENITLGDLLARRAAAYPSKVYLRHEDQAVTYAEFDRRVNQVSHRLLAAGITRGDRIGLFMENSIEFLVIYFAIARAGAVMVPMNAGYRDEQLHYTVSHSEQALLFADEDKRDLVERVRGRCPSLRDVIYVAGPESLATWAAGSPATPVPVQTHPGDLAGIFYTSGTTAHPKGVMLPHRSYVLGAHFWCSAFNCTAGDTLYGFFPLFHANCGVYLVVGALLYGATFAFRRGFSVTQHWDEVRRLGATQFNSVGSVSAMLEAQPQRPGERDHQVRVVVNGLNAGSIKESFERRFGVVMLDGYSLTECLTGLIERLEDLPSRHPGRLATCGRPSDWVQVRLVDDDGREVPEGVPGEITLKGPAVCLGYYKDPEATRQAIRDGWLHTGDMAYRDAEGFYYFVDRKKDMIKRRGENIASAEVERVLNAHPAVQESAVIGVPDVFADEEVKAYIIPRPGMQVDPWDLIEHCRRHLEDFKVPRYIEFRDSFPRPAAIAKILKTALRSEREDLTQGCFDRGPKLPPRRN